MSECAASGEMKVYLAEPSAYGELLGEVVPPPRALVLAMQATRQLSAGLQRADNLLTQHFSAGLSWRSCCGLTLQPLYGWSR